MNAAFKSVALAMLLFGATSPPPARAEPGWSPDFERQVKIGFLYNFAKFIEWPSEAIPESGAPFTVGVLGDDPFCDALEESLHDKTINSRPVVVRRLLSDELDNPGQILFISPSLGKGVPAVLARLRNQPVLTVGDMVDFAALGGVINFKIEGHRVRFEINIDAAQRAGLRVGSQLLAIATVVHDARPGSH
jgi:YfiR/HmsC-like